MYPVTSEFRYIYLGDLKNELTTFYSQFGSVFCNVMKIKKNFLKFLFRISAVLRRVVVFAATYGLLRYFQMAKCEEGGGYDYKIFVS